MTTRESEHKNQRLGLLLARVACVSLMLYVPLPRNGLLPVLLVVFCMGFLSRLWQAPARKTWMSEGVEWLCLVVVALYRYVPSMQSPFGHLAEIERFLAALLGVFGAPVRTSSGSMLQWVVSGFLLVLLTVAASVTIAWHVRLM